MKLRTSTSHEEGCERDWSVSTRRALGNGKVEALELVRVDWIKDKNGGWQLEEMDDSAFTIPADLVLLAMGFVHPTHDALLRETGVALDARGNVRADTEAEPGAYQTNIPKRCSPPATCGAANRWSSGRFARAGKPRAPSISSWWVIRSCRGRYARQLHIVAASVSWRCIVAPLGVDSRAATLVGSASIWDWAGSACGLCSCSPTQGRPKSIAHRLA